MSKLRQGATEQAGFGPDPIPMADPTYEQTQAQGRKPEPSRNHAVSANSEALPGASIVGSTVAKRAGALPIEATAKE
jgi:hypothetical protein